MVHDSDATVFLLMQCCFDIMGMFSNAFRTSRRHDKASATMIYDDWRANP